MALLTMLVQIFGTAHAQYECTESDTWIELPSVPISIGEAASAVIDDDLFVAGEVNEETYKYSFQTHEWSQVADRLYKSNHHGSFALNGEWWLIGGMDSDSYDKVQAYNPNLDQWRLLPELPFDTGSPCVVLIDEIIYSCGGVTGFFEANGTEIDGGTDTTDRCVKYDTRDGMDGQWLNFTTMPYGRNHAATTKDDQGRMWVFGGREGRV